MRCLYGCHKPVCYLSFYTSAQNKSKFKSRFNNKIKLSVYKRQYEAGKVVWTELLSVSTLVITGPLMEEGDQRAASIPRPGGSHT